MAAVRIVHLSAPVFAALAKGDLAGAEAASPVPLSPYLADPVHAGTWARRLLQVLDDPAEANWVTGAIWDTAFSRTVGRAGFHSSPDPAGLVEIGYAVDPQFRRQGYGREALRALLDRAWRDPGVRRVRLSISPENVPSTALASYFAFQRAGEQWDDEDGLEILWEKDVSGLH